MEGRTKSSSRALSVAQEAAEVSGRAYLPWWQKWDYNGVEIIRREREYRRKKKREDEREEVVKKEKKVVMVYLLERKKEEEEEKKGRGKRRGGLRRGAYRTVKSLVWPPAVVVAVHRHNQIPYHSTLHYYYKYLYNCTPFYILNNISALVMMNLFMITPLCILCTLYTVQAEPFVEFLPRKGWQTHCASSWGLQVSVLRLESREYSIQGMEYSIVIRPLLLLLLRSTAIET